jgi:hypothetical protein
MSAPAFEVGEDGRKVYAERRCAYEPCSRLFRPEREWQKYHTRRCANADRMARYQERHKATNDASAVGQSLAAIRWKKERDGTVKSRKRKKEPTRD